MNNDRRIRLAEVFRDTQNYYQTNPELAAAVERSKALTHLYEVGETPDFPMAMNKAGRVTIAKIPHL